MELGHESRASEALTGTRRLGLGCWRAPRLGAAIGRLAFVLAVGCADSRSRPSVDIPEGSQRIAPLHCAPGWS